MADNREKQLEIAERLQLKLLTYFEKQLDAGAIAPAECATLAKILRDNGWNIDPAKVPSRLRDMLTKGIDAAKLEEDDADVRGH